MSGAPGTGTAIGGSPIGFVLARGGTPHHRVLAGLAGGAQAINRLGACAPLLSAAGSVPSITVRETFEMAAKSVARTEGTAALAVTSAAIATNGMRSAVIVATVTIAVIAAMIVVASAVVIAVKIVSLRSAVIAAMTVAASAVVIAVKIAVRSAVIVAKRAVKRVLVKRRRKWAPVANTKVAMAAGKRLAIVNNIKSVAASRGMTEVTAATIGVEVRSRRPITAANALTLPQAMRRFRRVSCRSP